MQRGGIRTAIFAIATLLAAGCSDDPAVTLTVEEALAAAFDDAASSTTYRVSQSTAQDLSSTALGIDSSAEIDPNQPTVVSEVSPEASHVVIDIAGLLGPAAAPGIDELDMEIWTDPDRLVIDSTGYQQIIDLNPGADLGPLAPGIGFVDLAVLGAEGPDVVAAVVGSGPIDLAALADNLPGALDDLERDADDPDVFRGTTTYTEFLDATGGDTEQLARSAAGGLALNLNVDPMVIGDIYIDFYDQAAVSVEVETIDGLVRVISTTTELSDIYAFIFSDENAARIGIAADEAASGRAAFADTAWTIDTRIEFEPDASLEIEPPPATDDDRTALWREFLITSGLIDG